MQTQKTEAPVFESGKIVVSTGDVKALDISFLKKDINVDVEDKSFIKRIIKMRREISQINLETEELKEGKKKSPSPLATLKAVAEALSCRGITVTLSYEGATVATIGSNARPTLLHLITKTKAVSINNFYRLVSLLFGVQFSKDHTRQNESLTKNKTPQYKHQEEQVEKVDVKTKLDWKIIPSNQENSKEQQ